jgi:hypothetical protein
MGGNFRLRKSVAVPGVAGKRGRTFKPGEEEALQEHVDAYNAAAGEDAQVDLDAVLARPGTVALDEDASQEELDDSLTALRGLTMASPERSVRWNQRIEKPDDAPDDDDDGPKSQPARRAATKVSGAKRGRSKK